MNKFQEEMCEEINVSVLRYCKYCLPNITNSYVVIPENDNVIIYKNPENNSSKGSFAEFWNDFIGDPQPVFIVGHTETLKKEVDEEIGLEHENIRKFKYFYEVFPEICGYVSAPFNQGLVRLEKEKIKNEKLGNLIGLLKEANDKLYEKIKNTLTKDNLLIKLSDFFEQAWQYFGVDPEEREEIGHKRDKEDQGIRNLKIQISNLIAGFVRIRMMGEERLKLLLIDNKPDRPLETIDKRFEGMFKKIPTQSGDERSFSIEDVFKLFEDFIDIYIYDGKVLTFKKFEEEIEKVKREAKPQIVIPCKELADGGNVTKEISTSDTFDLILVDMYLGKDEPDGIEVLNQLTDIFPHIPAFVLSISEDFEVMHKAAEAGADYYIIKNQTFSVPYAYCKYLENIGGILKYFGDDIKSKEYKKDLLGNIRYWKFKKNLLWFGDKCYHMIDHSYKHTLDDWNYMNKVLIPLINEKTKQEIFGEDDDLLYAFSMAVWLHDIGHKGNDNYGEPHLIRDNHGYLSGELILRYPEIFRIKDFVIIEIDEGKEVDDYYDHNSIDYSQVSAIEMIYNREMEKLTTTEMIALIAMYHKSNTPIDWTEYKKLMENKKSIPLEYFIDKNENEKNIITLERILDKRLKIQELKEEYEKWENKEIEEKIEKIEKEIEELKEDKKLGNEANKNKIDGKISELKEIKKYYHTWMIKERLEEVKKFKSRFLNLAALFRFIDSIDIRSIRVGDVTEKELKKAVIKNDAEYQFKKMKNELVNLSKDINASEAAIFVKTFYQDVLEKIKTGEFTQLNLPVELLKDKGKMINYESLVDYASFIALQPTHFNLHSSVKKIDFIYKGNLCFDINLTTDKEKKDLEKMKVRERGKKEQSVYDRIIGENCYIKKELEGAKHILKQCLNNVKISLIHSDSRIINTINWNSND